MKALMRSRMWLFTAGAAAFAGGLALLTSNGERISEAARLASANAAPTSAAPASGWNDFLLCHTPPKAATAITSSMIRLAAAQTEAPQAKTNAASPALAFADTDPPVWDGLGSLSYKVTTSSPAAQVYFDQGLRLTYAFNHEEAQRAFRKAQKLDPDCAMCFWGEALVLGPNINLPSALGDNKTAMAVDEAYLAANEVPMGVYRLGYYPHNVHFVMASALMAGDGPSGISAAEKLRGLVPDQAALAIPGAHPVKAAPYFAHAMFSPPDVILVLPDPGMAIPYVKAMWHYARGIAYVARRDLSAATAEAGAIEALARTADFSLLKTAGIPASDVLELARNVIEGRVALAQGDANKAIERFEQAAGLQETLPCMEPPYWYYPVRQSLAVALMQAGRLDDAEGQFRRALARAPNNGWSYYGLAELYRTRGDAEAARKAEAELVKTWVGDRQLLQLSKL